MAANDPAQVSLDEAVRFLDRARSAQVRKLCFIRGLWIALVLMGLCFYIDAAVLLSGGQRLALNGLVAVLVLTVAVVTYRQLMAATSRRRMLARLIERAHPEINNDLVNAIDFEERLDAGVTKDASEELMGQGIVRAVEEFDELDGVESLRPPTLREEKHLLWTVAGAWVILALVLHGWFLAELPRFISPFGDHPPYSPTKLHVDPRGAVVDYGKDLKVSVTASGKIPEQVWLDIKTPAGELINRVGMFSSEAGQYFQAIEKIRSDLIYCASIQRGRSRHYPITLSKIPRIEAVHVQYKYPSYTGLAEKSIGLALRDSLIKGYKGTEVTMTVRSNRPLKSGVVKVGDATFASTAADANSVTAVFPLDQAGPFAVSVTDVEGNVSTELFEGKISLVADGKPMISIVSPPSQSMAVPTVTVPIVIEAQDDLGIRNIRIYRSHNESDDAPKLLYESDEALGQVQVVEELDLADLGVRPGDTIEFYATATDSLPTAPQTVATEGVRIQIISEEQYAEMMRSQMTAKDLREKYEEIMSRLDALVKAQQELTKETEALQARLDANDPQLSPEAAKQQLDALAAKQQQINEQAQQFAENLRDEAQKPPVFDIEEDFKKGLQQFAGNLDKAGEHMGNSARQMQAGAQSPQNRPGNVAQAADEQRKALEQLGQQMQDMKDTILQAAREMEKMMDLIAQVEMFRQLYLAQKTLTRQTRTYKDIEAQDLETKVRFKELAEREDTIKSALEQVKENLRDHGEVILPEYPQVAADAFDIADEIESRQIPPLMASGASFLHTSDGPQAYPKVLAALEQMEEMISFVEGASGKGSGQCEFRLRIMMALNPGDTMNQFAQGLSLNMGAGMSMGMGAMGGMGRGASGFGGGYSPIGMFGDETFGKNTATESLPSASTAASTKVQAGSLPEPLGALAGNIEQLSTQAKKELDVEAKGGARMMSEYTPLIEAYFRRLAEEE